MSARQYGRIYHPDARDWPLERFLPAAAPLPMSVEYVFGPILDQGQTSECTAYSGRAWLNAGPVVNHSGPTPDALYRAEQVIDGIPLPHDGSTVRACAQVLQHDGFIPNYAFTQNVTTVATWMLAGKGPVMVGTNFYLSMETPDPDGMVHIRGPVAGGHAYLLVGYSRRTRRFHAQNSWGRAWGVNGTFSISDRGMGRLLREQGEACTAVEVPH